MTDNNSCQNKKKWLDISERRISLLPAICGTGTTIFANHSSLNINKSS